jgi:hypothetical protein
MQAKTNAAVTVNLPISMLVIPIEEKVNASKTNRIII